MKTRRTNFVPPLSTNLKKREKSRSDGRGGERKKKGFKNQTFVAELSTQSWNEILHHEERRRGGEEDKVLAMF